MIPYAHFNDIAYTSSNTCQKILFLGEGLRQNCGKGRSKNHSFGTFDGSKHIPAPLLWAMHPPSPENKI